MKKLVLLVVCAFSGVISLAQFQVGHTTITFNDPTRTGGFGSGGGPGRQIQTEIYYPAATAGDNVPVSAGNHPVIVFGHGFAMAWDAYANVWDKMAKEGYILAFPRTEGGLIPAPSHANFGLDLALVGNKMAALNTTTGSLFIGKLNGNVGIMGHSMGGGASFLAAANNTAIKTVVGLAPAQTDPEASAAAANVSVPALILSGTSDGVTPAADHHTLIYNGLTQNCKYFLNLIGGAHCYFANSNFNCDFGESTSSSGITLTRAQQQTLMFDYIMPWFDYFLKEDCGAWNDFVNPQATDTRITPLSTCSIQAPTTPVITANGSLSICPGGSVQLTSSASSGNQWSTNATGQSIQVSSAGSYTVTVTDANGCEVTSAPVNVTIAAAPQASVTNQSANVLVATPAGQSYQWLNCSTGQLIAGQTAATLTVAQNGSYAAIVTNTAGCSDTSACVQVTGLSLEDLANNLGVVISPNPTQSDFLIAIENELPFEGKVWTADGKLITSFEGIQSKMIQTAAWENGVYFVHIQQGEQKSVVRLVKN